MHTLDQAFYDRLSEALGERLRACEESGRVPVVTGEFDFGFGFCFFFAWGWVGVCGFRGYPSIAGIS